MAVNQISLGIRAEITLNKDITTVTGSESVTIGLNPDYDANFTGDADLLEQRFVRFSYRFRFEDNEYSLSAPFTQICFIPKQYGQIGYGRNSGTVDMLNIYDSTVVEWFENRIDSIVLKVPLPDGGRTVSDALSALTSDYKVKSIDILYKESDALITRIVKTIDVSDIVVGDIEAIPTNDREQFYYKFDYKSIQVSRTLPSNQQNRVYDNVPIKALAQEVTGNRVVYGNFVQKHTPRRS